MPKLNPKDQAALVRVPLQLLPAVTEILGAAACRDGAIKYGPYNWRETPILLMGYLGAMGRHIKRMMDGEDVDRDSGLPHCAHIIATAGIIEDARLCGTLIDDRPKMPGKASELLDRLRGQFEAKLPKEEPTAEPPAAIPTPFAQYPDRILFRGADSKLHEAAMTHWLCMAHGRTEPTEVPCCHEAAKILEAIE